MPAGRDGEQASAEGQVWCLLSRLVPDWRPTLYFSLRPTVGQPGKNDRGVNEPEVGDPDQAVLGAGSWQHKFSTS